VAPLWEGFLEQVQPEDEESKEFIEARMGYCMTEETKFQKGAMFIGKPRSGKGTICHVIQQLVGARSYVSLTFHKWVECKNSTENVIGKRARVCRRAPNPMTSVSHR
jgi:putative DNA primase/helicase